ncbi:hypothetical protein [Flavobacterium tegetincola]|uniref:hypothetical protein n=1 Tax=Flavobacterium tegetincola TaxID=150172 RepID=UPI0004053F8D|nr:hypothetical protein [Flavobacterium tegetincola]
MKYQVTINHINNVDDLEHYWTNEDYVNLLAQFDYPEAKSTSLTELQELLSMAVSDFEPNDAASKVLAYKLSDHLNEGQIDQLSNEMLIDKVCEEYPEIGLHADLYQINQLLYKAYNGKFLNAKASIISCTITPDVTENSEPLSKAAILRVLYAGFSPRNVIKRLFNEQLTTDVEFVEAEDILWHLNTSDNITYEIITSEYWLDREDFAATSFPSEVSF